jgi:hypothetical protein
LGLRGEAPLVVGVGQRDAGTLLKKNTTIL